ARARRGTRPTRRGRPAGGRAGPAPVLCRTPHPGGRPGPRHLPPDGRPHVGLRPGLAPPGSRRRARTRGREFGKFRGVIRRGTAPCLVGGRTYHPGPRVMNERDIFIEALDRDTPAGRAAYLDEACAGDPALRERVEALLRSHEEAGEFPGKLAPQRLADEF